MTNKNVAIKGDGTAETGKRIIEYLEGIGARNCAHCTGSFAVYYYIDDDAFEIYLNAKEIDPPKPITTDEKIADLQKQIDELKNMMR